MEDSTGSNPQSPGFTDKLKSWLSWSWTYVCFVWFGMVLIMIYVLWSPLKLQDSFTSASLFLNTLTPKFYVALTGTSSLISGLILIFEWWYFRKYGTSFIEQVSVSHLRPLLGGVESSSATGLFSSVNGEAEPRPSVSECKVWRNPLNLFRGAEYNRYTWVTGKEPLTYYDMNLSAQDHQTFFTGETQQFRPEDSVMQKAWRERNPQARIRAAYQAIELNHECAAAYVLLAEEEATTITEAERLFKKALSIAGKDINLLVYIKRRLAMCARKLGRIKEAVKMMRDLMKEFPLLGMLNIHENLLEALLELQAYADVQAVLAKYDDISLPKSATICYTSALLKARAVSDKFSPEAASRRGLSTAEMNAVEAIHRAVEFNPHVPKNGFFFCRCAAAYVLLAEEEATTITEAERLFKKALSIAGKDINLLVYIKRRLAMCARKLGRIKEAVKMMRDLMKEFPLLGMLNIHENLLEALLELQAYADVQAVLAKYDDISLPKSATICYTSALLKARAVSDKFSPEAASRRGLSTAEMNAVEAIHRAVEFNPHVPKYLLEMKSLILPPEHILKRGDSEAVAYAFFHLQHWKRAEGALNLLHCTWEGTFRIIPYPLEKGHLFYPYPGCTETADRELLPSFHEVSVYPKKELPFFILFTAGLCSFTAMLAMLTHQFPELMGVFAKAFFSTLFAPLGFFADKMESFMPSSFWHQLTRI
ncbi:suppressor of tumorigenicity 7 protein-like [Hippocampus comes]|uniref:suppressor of tumorigenicity 7 protein-like n=1 Tax=Hippocampus comes TaxID=109280 RepID=UPI00094EF6F8|nr:PREDICTED: suppressor of tumorigenicity 7 protein-like [Hippocampus comes]